MDDDEAAGLGSWLKGEFEKAKNGVENLVKKGKKKWREHKKKKLVEANVEEKKTENLELKKKLQENPIYFYYQFLPECTKVMGFTDSHAMVALGYCAETQPEMKFETSPGQDRLHIQDLLSPKGVWKMMGEWNGGNLRKLKSRPPNMTDNIYIEKAVHPATPRASFTGGSIKAIVSGQKIYCDMVTKVAKLPLPYEAGEEGKGLKKGSYFLFIYTVLNPKKS